MTSSMLRRQLKNLVQNYSEAEVKVREATSNDPWGPSSSQMADISDLTYNVVACNEIMTMLWKRLKDDRNWRHIHKSLTLLEYLLKTGDERVLLKMKDNIYIVKALTEYRFSDKDGKDQGVNVRDKAKVVLVLMEDDEKLKEERDFAFKTREKTSKGAAASSSDAVKDPTYKPCYVPGASGLPSLDNIPSVADLTASFAARKEEKLKQEAEKKEAERRAKLSEDELQWEDAGKGSGVKDDAWGGGKPEEELDEWGAPKQPKEAEGPWGTPDRPETTDTEMEEGADAWGAPTKPDEDPFSAPKNGEDPFVESEDPFGAPEEVKFTEEDSEDPFQAPKDNSPEGKREFPVSEEDPFTSKTDDPFSTPKNDPFSTDKEDPFSTPKEAEDPFGAPKVDPFTSSKSDPFNIPKDDPFSSKSDDPFGTPKDDPFNAPKEDPFKTQAEDPFGAPKDDPFTSSKSDPFDTPKEDPFGVSKDDPFTAAKEGPKSPPPNDDPFSAPSKPVEDPFSAPMSPNGDAFGAPTSPPKDDPFSTAPADDPFAAPTTPPKEDPFSAPTKPSEPSDPFASPTSPPKDDPFVSPTSPPKDDPFTAPTSPPKDDPFTAPTSPPKDDPFTAPTSPPKDDPFTAPKDPAVDPFSAPSPPPSADAWGEPTSPPPSSDAWGAASPLQETKAGDPWGDGPSAKSPVDNSDPFGDTTNLDNDPWGAPASAPVNTDDAWGAPAPDSLSSPSDPFGSKGDPWGAPSSTSQGTGRRSDKDLEMFKKTTSFLGSAGASLVDLDDLFSSTLPPKHGGAAVAKAAVAWQPQAAGALNAPLLTPYHQTSYLPGGHIGSSSTPSFSAFGLASQSTPSSLFQMETGSNFGTKFSSQNSPDQMQVLSLSPQRVFEVQSTQPEPLFGDLVGLAGFGQINTVSPMQSGVSNQRFPNSTNETNNYNPFLL
ncbi:epsin-1-like [Periophthalmus magnuspinnatus]|uniref:epsin-1-like n=1 Tax=Periophthalmus magnuspinnatus TaxID=409849 RepID=UPI0024367898|nr:epsin-1-like [Periophthalmus magnuspinnatus]